MRRPFYWKARGGWYVKTARRQNHYLGATEEAAQTAWAEMVAADRIVGGDALVAALAEAFLADYQRTAKPATYQWRARYIADFCKAHGLDRVAELRPFHVTKWLDGHAEWNPDSRRAAIGAVKRLFNWAKEQGLVLYNPFDAVKKPKGGRRQKLVTAAEHESLGGWQSKARGGRRGSYAKRDGAFRAVLVALRHAGVRSGTIAAVRVEHVAADASCWVVPEHKTVDKIERPIVVYLSPCLQALTRALIVGRTSGPLFRNSRGEAWSANAIRCRMRRLRAALGIEAGTVAYSYRHSYITGAILAGNDVATVAELVGHKDCTMIAKHYGHLAGAKDHLKRAAARAVQ